MDPVPKLDLVLLTDVLLAVDEDRRSTSNSVLDSLTLVRLDLPPKSGVLAILVPPVHVLHAGLAGGGDEVRVGEPRRAGIERIVHLPESSLSRGGEGSHGRRQRVVVSPDREVLEAKPHLLAHVIGDLVIWMLPNNLPHIGIVVDVKRSNPLIVHNIGLGPVLEDMLFEYPITGHYRYYGSLR